MAVVPSGAQPPVGIYPLLHYAFKTIAKVTYFMNETNELWRISCKWGAKVAKNQSPFAKKFHKLFACIDESPSTSYASIEHNSICLDVEVVGKWRKKIFFPSNSQNDHKYHEKTKCFINLFFEKNELRTTMAPLYLQVSTFILVSNNYWG